MLWTHAGASAGAAWRRHLGEPCVNPVEMVPTDSFLLLGGEARAPGTLLGLSLPGAPA